MWCAADHPRGLRHHLIRSTDLGFRLAMKQFAHVWRKDDSGWEGTIDLAVERDRSPRANETHDTQ
jgi:hypothetical protein